MLRVICLNAGMVLHPLVERDELRRYAIGEVGWDVVELPGLEVVDPDEDFEVGNREAAARKVSASVCIEVLLKASEIKRDRAIGKRSALRLLLVVGQVDRKSTRLNSSHGS